MKKNLIRILLLFLLIADMAFIFSNSAQSGSASSSASKSVTEKVAPVVVPNYDKMTETEQKDAVLTLDGIVREAAHLLQFMPIGFSLYLLLRTFELSGKIRNATIPITLCFGLLYAVSDELHQLLTPGRSFQLFDVFMDTCGVTIGCVGGLLTVLIIKAIRKNRETSSHSA